MGTVPARPRTDTEAMAHTINPDRNDRPRIGADCGSSFSNYELIVPYFLPYGVYVTSAKLFGRFGSQIDYSLRILLVTGCLFWAWKWYRDLFRSKDLFKSLAWGGVYGTVGFFVWVLLLYPVIDDQASPWKIDAFILRIVAATFLVPIFEEVLVRGYLFRTAYQYAERKRRKEADALANTLDLDSLDNVAPGAWNWFAVLFSSAAFTFGHSPEEWPAAFAYGMLVAGVWIHMKNLFSCIIAHATTNLLLGLFVLFSGKWGFW